MWNLFLLVFHFIHFLCMSFKLILTILISDIFPLVMSFLSCAAYFLHFNDNFNFFFPLCSRLAYLGLRLKIQKLECIITKVLLENTTPSSIILPFLFSFLLYKGYCFITLKKFIVNHLVIFSCPEITYFW